MITDERIAELRAVCADATPGPWLLEDNGTLGGLLVRPPAGRPHRHDHGEDAEFVATARTALPELLAEIERMRPVYLAAIEWRRNDTGAEALRTCRVLIDAVDAAEKSEELPAW